jgi:hypothetical protein
MPALTFSHSNFFPLLAAGVLPFVAALVGAGVAWAKDLSQDARRLRSIDEVTKRVAFWSAWRSALDVAGELSEERERQCTVAILLAGEYMSRIQLPMPGVQNPVMRIFWPNAESGIFESSGWRFVFKGLIAADFIFAALWIIGVRELPTPPRFGVFDQTTSWLAAWTELAVLMRVGAPLIRRYVDPKLDRIIRQMGGIR